MSHTARFTISIPAAGLLSPALSTMMSKGALRSTLGNTESIELFGPPALTGVVTVQVCPRYGGTVWRNLQVNGADVTVPAGKALTITFHTFEDLRFSSTLAEAAQRDIDIEFQITMGS